jgi:hypothetical protein
MTESVETIREELVTTRGLSSRVVEDGETVGHVLLLDIDDGRLFEVLPVLDEQPGHYALFESSPGSYHLWDIAVRDLDEQLLRALRLSGPDRGDAEHVAISSRREEFVVRAAPKFRPDGEVYKDAPTLDRVWSRGDPDAAISAPHAEYIREVAERDGVDIGPGWDATARGETLVGPEYISLSDDLKRRG